MTNRELFDIARECGFDKAYVLEPFPAERMEINTENERLSDDPRQIMENVTSVIVLIKGYKPFIHNPELPEISAYYPASQSAYLSAKEVAKRIEAEGYRAISNAQVAIKPMLVKSGIGTPGKNTLIDIEGFGTRFHVQVILTDMPFENERNAAHEYRLSDSCAGCGKCIKACPTGAISEGGFDFRKCLRAMDEGKIVPEDMRIKVGNRLFGCDTCQDVCPRNAGIESVRADERLIRDTDLNKLLSGDLGDLSLYIGRNYARKARIRMKAALNAGCLMRKDALDGLRIMAEIGTDGEKIHASWAIDRIEKGGLT